MAAEEELSNENGTSSQTWLVGQPTETRLPGDGPQLFSVGQPPTGHQAPVNRKESETGRVLPGKIGEFTIMRQLGRGGMGVVYEARQESLNRIVALKVLPLGERFDQRQIQRFQNEARAAAQLHHENIVPVYSVGADAGVHFYAMQLIQGHDLAHFISRARSLVESKVAGTQSETPRLATRTTISIKPQSNRHARESAPARENGSAIVSFSSDGFIELMADRRSSPAAHEVLMSVVQIGIQAADALHHAHLLGIVHRDIKPSNLLLDEQGKVWVTDFGLAHVQGAAALTMTGEVVGTLRYMSPEQPLGQRVLVDQRTDIYSLGVTLYELLTLKKAYDGTTPKEIIRQVCFDDPVAIRRLNHGIPEDLETIVLKAMSRNPDDRYQTAQELADDLRRFGQDLPILARRPTLIQRCRRWMRRHVVLATSAAVAMVVLCLTSLAASAMIWSSLTAETQQRKRAESLLEKSEGLRLTANSSLERENNPGLALLLAVKGAELNPGVDANSALLNALRSNHELQTFSPRAQISDHLSISPDGMRVVTTVGRSYFGKGSYPAIESDLQTGRTLRTFDDGTAMTSAVYSPDGKYLLTTSAPNRHSAPSSSEPASPLSSIPIDAVPQLWNTATGNRKFSWNDAGLDVVSGAAFSPDSRRIALPGRDNSVRIYSTKDGQVESSLSGHTDHIIATAFSPGGDRLVSMARDNTIRVWDAAAGVELQRFPVQPGTGMEQPPVFADSERLVISTAEGTRIMSVDSGEQLNPRHWPESASAVSPDGRQLALFLKYGKHVTIRDTESFRLNSRVDVDDFIVSVVFSTDGRRLLVTTVSQATVYNSENGEVVARLKGHTRMLTAGKLSQDGEHVVTAAQDGTVRFWSVQSGAERMRLVDQPASIAPSPWGFSSDAALAVVATQGKWYSELWNAEGLRSSAEFSGRVSSRFVNSDRLVTIDHHQVLVCNVPASRRIASMIFEMEMANDAVAVPGTDMVVVLLERGAAVLWNTATGERIPVSDAEVEVLDFDVHPEDGRIVLAEDNGNARVLNAVTGSTLRTLVHDKGVVSVSFSPTGTRLLTVDSANTARIWSEEDNQPLQTMHAPGGLMNRAMLSPDETAILTWTDSGEDCVRSWQTETGELIMKSGAITTPGIAVSSVEPLVAMASVKDGLTLWNWKTGEQRRLSESPVKTPVFLGHALMSIDAVPGFQDSQSMISGYGSIPAFARSALTVRNVASGEVISSQPLSVAPWNLCPDQASGQALLCFRTHNVVLVKTDERQELCSASRHAAPIVFSTIAGKTSRIVSASMDGTATVSDLSGRQLFLLEKHKYPIVNAAVSPDGLRLATFDTAGTGILWNLEDGNEIMELTGHSGIVPILRFSGSGKFLLTSGSDSEFHIWDLIARTRATHTFLPGIVTAEWSPDDSQLLVITGRVRSAADAETPGAPQAAASAFLLQLRTETQTNLEISGVPKIGRFRPDGKQVVLISTDGQVTICDTVTGKSDGTCRPDRQPALDAVFSPDGQDLLLKHADELSLWDLDVGDEILRIPNLPTSQVGKLLLQTYHPWNPFSPDSEWIHSAGLHLERWPRDPLKVALGQVPRPLTDIEKQRFSVDMISGAASGQRRR